jgi:hypothetical protein
MKAKEEKKKVDQKRAIFWGIISEYIMSTKKDDPCHTTGCRMKRRFIRCKMMSINVIELKIYYKLFSIIFFFSFF